MPNWVKNIVTVSKSTMLEIKEKYFTDGELDFNKIIPMPSSLDLTEGSITDASIFYAYSRKDKKTQEKIKEILENINDDYYGDYWKKINNFNNDNYIRKVENIAKSFDPKKDAEGLNINTLEELGDIYLKNIEDYGAATWYDWRIKNWGTKWEVSRFICNDTTMIFETAWSTPEPIFYKLSKKFPDAIIEVRFADECFSNYNNGYIKYNNGIIENKYELDEDFSAKVWNEELESKDITDEMFD